jgi:hypothetical protein
MDPHLESPAYWPGFHARFITYWCDALSDVLPANYEAEIDERFSLVEVPPDVVTLTRPDIAITQLGDRSATVAPAGGTATLAPVSIPLVIEDEHRETYIRVLHRPDRSLVAVLELLSPANKTGSGRAAYLDKRNALLLQDVHLVEVDLLVGGQRPPVRKPLPAGDYFAYVARVEQRPNCDVYAWTVQQPLPTVPIPLRAPDPDVMLDLGAVFNTAFERGHYARKIDRSAAVAAPFSTATREWIAERLGRAGGQ